MPDLLVTTLLASFELAVGLQAISRLLRYVMNYSIFLRISVMHGIALSLMLQFL